MRDRFILIGHPVGHSVSPAIHEKAYELLGRHAKYDLVDCPTLEAVLGQVDAIRKGELRGANVTVPWKRAAFEAADEHHETALQVGVANVLARTSGGRVIAYNTDAMALGTELGAGLSQSGLDWGERRSALILGAGGAALAAIVGCRIAGIEEVGVTARRFDPAKTPASWPGATGLEKLSVRTLPWPSFQKGPVRDFARSACLIVQASSAGMKGTSGGDAVADLVPWSSLAPSFVYDLVYNPPLTPFLERASQEGHVCQGGLGMLVGQAAQAINIWWGEAPPLPPLMAAARRSLGL